MRAPPKFVYVYELLAHKSRARTRAGHYLQKTSELDICDVEIGTRTTLFHPKRKTSILYTSMSSRPFSPTFRNTFYCFINSCIVLQSVNWTMRAHTRVMTRKLRFFLHKKILLLRVVAHVHPLWCGLKTAVPRHFYYFHESLFSTENSKIARD